MEHKEEWKARGLCVGSRVAQAYLFSANKKLRKLAADELCAECPVRSECEDYGYRTEQTYGVWGGVDFENRNVVRSIVCASASCGKTFTSDRKDAQYCSAGCRQDAYRARMAEHAKAQ